MGDIEFMRMALEEAQAAASVGDVPVGAVIVLDGAVIGRGRNRREVWQDPCAHAEVLAIREAAASLGRWRLSGATLYVTLEPCIMCMGASVLARVDRLVFGAFDPKAGAAGSILDLSSDSRLNHRFPVTAGVEQEACSKLLRAFFAGLRQKRAERPG